MQAQTTTPPALWIGIDVAKAKVDAALYISSGGKNPSATFARTPQGMAELLAWAKKNSPAHTPLRALLEATGRYSAEAAAWLLENDPTLAPAIINPLHAKRFAQSLGLRNKTDKIDAQTLARMGAERTPAPYEAPGHTILELRALVRERRTLIDERTRLINRMKEGTDSTFVKKERARTLKQLETTIGRIDMEIEKVAAADPSLSADIALLQTIPGVGALTAITVLAELGDLRRFESGRKLASFAGLSPRRHESGSTVRGRSRMSKQGNSAVRAILYPSAMASKRMEKGMRRTYERLLENKKAPMVALGAIMRRQLILMRAILKSGKPYESPVEKNTPKHEKSVA